MKILINQLQWIIRAASAVLLISSAAQIYAAGFAIDNLMGNMTLGRSHAGGAAIAEDASTVFANPAGLTRLSGQELLFVTNFIAPSINFQNHGSTDITNTALKGGNGGNGGSLEVLPNFYYANALSDNLTVGFAFNSPFGLSSEYDPDWVGRYYTIKASLLNINLNPGLGFKVNDILSIGAGINLNYVDFEGSNAIDFGTILGAVPQSMDGIVELDGDSLAWGFNLGMLLDLNKHTRIGIAYRSKIKHTIKGNANFSVPAAVNPLQPLFTDTTFELPINLPESISISLYHQATSRLAVMTDFTYTRWSRIQEMRTSFGNSAQPDLVIPRNWDNTWRIAVGLDYTYIPAWRFQAGLSFDQAAIPDETYDPMIPSQEGILLSLGTLYQYSKILSFGVAYSYFTTTKKQNVHLNRTAQGALNGEIDTGSHILGVELDLRF